MLANLSAALKEASTVALMAVRKAVSTVESSAPLRAARKVAWKDEKRVDVRAAELDRQRVACLDGNWAEQ